MRTSSLLLVLPFVLGACASETPRTQVMVSIEPTAEIAAAADRLRVEIIVPDGAGYDMQYEGEAVTLPFIVGVVPRGGDVSRTFTARASLHATPYQYQATTTTGFIEGRTLWLRLQITDACRTSGSCNQNIVDPETLEEWPGEAALRTDAGTDSGVADAGEMDAGVDAGEMDAGDVDAGCTSPSQCDDGNPCTDDLCDAGVCAHENNADFCTDDDACSTISACQGGTCQPQLVYECGENERCRDDAGTPSCECVAGFVACGEVCIPTETCCDDPDDCPGGDVCPSAGGSCGCPASAPIRCDGACFPECCPGTTGGCDRCGTRVCGEAGRWGACTGQRACNPGDGCSCEEPGGCSTGTCGGCGFHQQRICDMECNWSGCFGG